jgi:hypothetical protein
MLSLCIVLSIVFSCQEFSSKKRENNETPQYINEESRLIEPNIIKWGIPFNVDSLKKEWYGSTTSTFLNDKSSQFLFRPTNRGVYIGYSILHEITKEGSENYEFEGGVLTVFNSDLLDKKNEDIFISFRTKYRGISIYDNISVGSPMSIVLDKFGKPIKIIDNNFVFMDDNNFLAIFRRDKNNKILFMYIGNMNEDFYNSLDANLEKLLTRFK